MLHYYFFIALNFYYIIFIAYLYTIITNNMIKVKLPSNLTPVTKLKKVSGEW